MEPVVVPSPPRQAFNKDRPISDLVRKQVEHFKHVEEKFPADIRAKLPQHGIATEDEAARYIAAITTYLLSRPRPKQVIKKAVAIKPRAPIPSPPLALAAAAAPVRKKSPAKKKSAAKKETPRAKKSLSIRAKAKKSSSKRKK